MAQELSAYLITYQAVRQLMHQTAVAADIDPDRLSFTTALRVVRRFLTRASATTGQLLGHLVDRAISQIAEDQNERRDRASARVVKRSQSPYPSIKHATQPTSTTVDYTIEVLHPGPRGPSSTLIFPALLRREALCHIPSSVGRNLEERSWV